MPQNVRNFWIELEVDGKKTKVATGPRSKDGEFYLSISMRNEDGSIHDDAIQIKGFACVNDKDKTIRHLAMTFYIDGCAVTTINNADPMEVTQH